jgi:TolB-like protein
MIQLGSTSFDRSSQMLRDASGAKIALRAQTLRVLDCLIKANGGLISKDHLASEVWGKVAVTDEHSNVSAIAVMAFTSVAGDEVSERLAQSFAGDLIAELAQQKSLRVIGRLSSFSLSRQPLSTKEVCDKLNARYLVSGQVQFSETSVSWSLEMMDGASDQIVWSERRKADRSELNAESDGLLWRLAGALNSALGLHAQRQALALHPESLNAFDLCSAALGTLVRVSVQSTREAQRLAAEAIKLYPNYAFAWRILAHSHSFDMVWCHSGQWTSAKAPIALSEISKAIELDSSEAMSFGIMSQLLNDNGQHQEAILAAEHGLTLSPSSQNALQFKANALFFDGRFKECRTAIETLGKLTVIRSGFHMYTYGRALLALGERQAAVKHLQGALTNSPGNSQARISLIVACEELGDRAAAGNHLKLLMAHTNGFDEGYFGRRWSNIPEIRDRFARALLVNGMIPARR